MRSRNPEGVVVMGIGCREKGEGRIKETSSDHLLMLQYQSEDKAEHVLESTR